jgi:lipoate-protein ligase A
MAIDEAVLRARIENLVPNTVRFYCWKPSAVSIGKFQNIENEVQLNNCRAHGVDVVRRITGGGTVYHDAIGEITYSLIADKKDLNADDIGEVYSKVYAGLSEALRLLGVKADFCVGDAKTCPNMTVKGKKISGSAQSHKKGIVLQHGTLLVDVDLTKMFTFLRVPWANTCMQIIRVAENKITSLKKELGRDIPTATVQQALITGFQRALKTELAKSELTDYEKTMAEKLCKEKYATDEWNLFGRTEQEKKRRASSEAPRPLS